MNSSIACSYKPWLILAVIGPFLAGCEVLPPRSGTTIDKIDEVLQSSDVGSDIVADESIPADVSDALLPPLDLALEGQTPEKLEQRFDIAANQIPVREFFFSLVEGTDYNIVVHPKIEGKISLNLRNVTVAEVMAVVRDIYGYDYRQSGNVYTLLADELHTQIFKINYLDIKRSGNSDIKIGSGQQVQSGDSSGEGDSGGSTTASLSGTSIRTDSEIDFWTDLQAALETIVGEDDGRKVVVNPVSGIAVISAKRSEIRQIEEFLDSIQKIVHRQVIIEAKILEVELNDGFQSGINWSVLVENDRNEGVVAGQVGGGSVFDGNVISSLIKGNSGNLNPRDPSAINGTAASAFGGIFSLALNFHDFNAFVEMLETQGNVQVLSSPRVATVNNQKAVIKVGTDEFFVTDISTTTTTSAGGESTTPDVKLTQFFSGILLDVTPQIDEEGYVIMHIHPAVSEVTDQTKSLNILDQQITLPLAFSSVRESDNLVRAKNGQLVVIGGLMQNTTKESVASVPLLGDLPFVGSLFRHTKQVAKKSELVLLLRPMVVENGNEWSQDIGMVSGRMGELNQGFHYGGKSELFGTMAETMP
ncbi:MAG: pilus (MSHA type) biogenesis protein MshL [Gammaproteobacteria bacterium]